MKVGFSGTFPEVFEDVLGICTDDPSESVTVTNGARYRLFCYPQRMNRELTPFSRSSRDLNIINSANAQAALQMYFSSLLQSDFDVSVDCRRYIRNVWKQGSWHQ